MNPDLTRLLAAIETVLEETAYGGFEIEGLSDLAAAYSAFIAQPPTGSEQLGAAS